MTDRVLIPFGDRVIVLDRATFERGLADGESFAPAAAVTPAAPAPLVDVAGVASALGINKSAVRELVRRGVIPVVLVGRLHRFDVIACRAALMRDGEKP